MAASEPQQISRAEQDRIVQVLNQRQATRPCARCNSNQFAILSGYVNLPVLTRLGQVEPEGPSIPCAAACCNGCGVLTLHALGPLGLIPPELGG